jgi:hypothetical protein
MFKVTAWLSVIILCWTIVVPYAHADMMPAVDDVESDTRAVVEELLVDTDIPVTELTDDEVAYFAENPDGLQTVGALAYDELIGGLWLLGLTIGLGLVIANEAN